MKDHIVEKYSDLKMGARPLKRAIQTHDRGRSWRRKFCPGRIVSRGQRKCRLPREGKVTFWCTLTGQRVKADLNSFTK
ncbi:MAG: hypothetical protein ACLTQL_07640 [Eisenbergiella sp.]